MERTPTTWPASQAWVGGKPRGQILVERPVLDAQIATLPRADDLGYCYSTNPRRGMVLP